jgi:hypothetical protein
MQRSSEPVEVMDAKAAQLYRSAHHSPLHQAESSFISITFLPLPKEITPEFVYLFY